MFAAFSEDLKNTLKSELDALYAGSIAKEGWVEFYFYAPDAKRFENLSSETMTRHGGFAYERGASRDTKWEMYIERLYPDAYAMLRIQNRHTSEALIEAGDDLNLEREIEHYLFFQTKSSLERAVSFLAAHGFALKEYVNDDESDYAYGVVLTKHETIAPDQVEESTALLFDAALEQHGHYEGWSTVLG
jgi:regulator of RNase E activity RraB